MLLETMITVANLPFLVVVTITQIITAKTFAGLYTPYVETSIQS